MSQLQQKAKDLKQQQKLVASLTEEKSKLQAEFTYSQNQNHHFAEELNILRGKLEQSVSSSCYHNNSHNLEIRIIL